MDNYNTLIKVRADGGRSYPRIGGMLPSAAIDEIIGAVTMACNYTGRTIQETDARAMAIALYNELMADEQRLNMRDLTVLEIGYAIKKAVLNDTEMYGINVASLYKVLTEMYGINVASLYKVLTAYCRGEGHEASMAADNIRMEADRKALKGSALGIMLDCYTTKMLNK